MQAQTNRFVRVRRFGEVDGLEVADGPMPTGAPPIDYTRGDYTWVLPDGFDAVFDGLGLGGFDRLFQALWPGGVLCAFGYSAGLPPETGARAVLAWLRRQCLRYLRLWRPKGRRLYI